MLSHDQTRLLLACDTFRALDEHARHLAGATLPGGAVETFEQANVFDDIKRQLRVFVEEGLLVSDRALREDIHNLALQSGTGEDFPEITSIGIPTRDRPESLRRALASYIENTTRFERTPEFTVVDNSQAAHTQVTNKDVLQALQHQYGIGIRYANQDQRAQYAAKLAHYAGFPVEILRFALLGDARCQATYGACRNALLLDAVGEVAVQADDDTVCRVALAPDVNTCLALTSKTDANEYWFFESFQEALASVSLVDRDFLAIHEQFLGGRMTACLAVAEAAGVDLDIMEMGPPFFENMKAPEAKVSVSFMGTVGDAGMHHHAFRLLHNDPTLDRLTATEHLYRQGLRTRQMIRVPTQPCISDGAFCMTINIGLDHRTLLPPFMPVMRNEDGIFGTLLRAIFPNSYTGYLPYMVLHLPPEERPFAPGSHRIGYQMLRVNDLLQWILFSLNVYPASPKAERNMRTLGRSLQDLSALPQEDFVDFLRTITWRRVSTDVAYAQRRLEDREGGPSYWVADVLGYLQDAQMFVMQPDFFIPSDLEGSPAERLALFQELVCKFGELLIYWPDIVEAAGALRARGERLATSL